MAMTPPPIVPDIADPVTFASRAQAFVLWLRDRFIPELGAITAAALPGNNTQQGLMCYLRPSMADGWRGIYRAGFDWWSRNQQWGGPWGGEMLDAATGTVYRTEIATGHIDSQSNSWDRVADVAFRTYRTQGFKVPETQTLSAVWIKLGKVGNPTNNLGLFIYTDNAGAPNTLHTNGTATAQSGKLHVAALNYGDGHGWYRFVFPSPPTLVGGTQYHIVLKSSGAADATNYWVFTQDSAKKYPFGYVNTGDATPSWTPLATTALNFLVELPAAAQTLQAAGQFDGKLQFGGSGASGTLSMSRGLCSAVPLRELMDPTENTGYLVGTALTKDVTFFDAGYGEDHDRIVIRSNITTGYAQIDVYDSSGVKSTVTATAVDLSAGTHSVGWYVRAKGDGADRVDLYVDGTTYPLSALTINFDKNFGNLGTMWLGGGFALAPTYSGSSIGINGFSGLPSTLGWTWSGVGTEANQYSVSGGKLYQNKNGFPTTDYGIYTKTIAGFSNTNGWNVALKVRVASSTNNVGYYSLTTQIHDGAKRVRFPMYEYFANASDTTGDARPQVDLRSADAVAHLIGKGSDFMAFVNRKLVVDATGGMTTADATNNPLFGDNAGTSGENADGIWSYYKYYTTTWLPPQFTSGSISELALWQGNMKSLWPLLYNAGAFVSARVLLGLEWNYVNKSACRETLVNGAITPVPSLAGSWGNLMFEMVESGSFVTCDSVEIGSEMSVSNSNASYDQHFSPLIDGVVLAKGSTSNNKAFHGSTPSGVQPFTIKHSAKTFLGLHRVAIGWNPDGGSTGYRYYQKTHITAKV